MPDSCSFEATHSVDLVEVSLYEGLATRIAIPTTSVG
jgi:hypothetical protein